MWRFVSVHSRHLVKAGKAEKVGKTAKVAKAEQTTDLTSAAHQLDATLHTHLYPRSARRVTLLHRLGRSDEISITVGAQYAL